MILLNPDEFFFQNSHLNIFIYFVY